MASKPMRALLAAMLLTACSGSLVDHLNDFQTGTGTLPDGGTTCNGTVEACGASCTACLANNGVPATSCTNNACVYPPATCAAPQFTCSSGCCVPSALAAGGSTTCAGFPDSVRCWGVLLGTGGTTSTIPMNVQNIGSANQIAVGADHACAIVSGAVRCWGANDFGQLGHATPATPAASPLAAVPGITDAVQVVVGTRHSCALTRGGSVFCWGANDSGQLGDGSEDTRTDVVQVPGMTNANSISASLLGACAVNSGVVNCWGSDAHGQIGNGAPISLTPVPKPTVATFKGGSITFSSLASGESHNCVVATDTVECWGAGTFGQIGNSSTTDQILPQKAGLLAPTLVAAGGAHTCASSIGGTAVTGDDNPTTKAGLYCWGNNDSGQLGTGTRAQASAPSSTTPISFPGVDTTAVPFIEIAAGTAHSCALLSGGSLFCWGANDQGEVGNGTSTGFIASPVQVVNSAP
jgi:alpha-tubulin suppressor-like RCC1 family protein